MPDDETWVDRLLRFLETILERPDTPEDEAAYFAHLDELSAEFAALDRRRHRAG